MQKWVPRLILALAVGLALPLLPALLTHSVGPGADLSGRLGLAGGVSAMTFAVLFVGGVLTSLTPCVYPLIPITVSIFGARQAEHRARSAALSAAYVAGIAAMFSALGLFAALSGKAFGTVLSSPAVVAVLAVLLVALAASMFGAYDIALPSALQQKLAGVRGTGFAGAFGMGLVAGIIAAPCTGPVLAGVLAYVATQRNALLGFWMLFTYAIGMGLIFFVLGATSLRLPRSGPWKAMKLGAMVVLLGGIGLSFGWFGEPRSEKSFRIPWLHDEKVAVQQSRASGKPLLIDFFAEWCAACKELDVHTWMDPVVAKEVAERFVPLKIDATEETEENDSLQKKYGVPGLPTVLMMACRDERPPECAVPGEGPTRVTGFLPPPEMLERLRRVQ